VVVTVDSPVATREVARVATEASLVVTRVVDRVVTREVARVAVSYFILGLITLTNDRRWTAGWIPGRWTGWIPGRRGCRWCVPLNKWCLRF
jgi:hypothetical protein